VSPGYHGAADDTILTNTESIRVSVRFPGIISSVTPPGGGTTDLSVDIYYSAVKGSRFVCPISEGTYMDMM
jgi:hypothetical protein